MQLVGMEKKHSGSQMRYQQVLRIQRNSNAGMLGRFHNRGEGRKGMRCLLVPLEYRRAFFDMDGTILCEKPDYIEVALTRHRLLEKVRRNPKLESNPVYKAVIEGDAEYLYKNIKTAIAEAFEGESLKFYLEYSRRFLSEEKHPKFNRAYIQLFYQPMIELIDYLTDHGFKVYIVSTSQQEFIRSVSKDILNIPKNQIIGTMVGFSLEFGSNNNPVFIRKSS